MAASSINKQKLMHRNHPSAFWASSTSLGTWELLEQPLTKQLRRDWARGTTSSKKVLETAHNAKHQGARDLDRIADKAEARTNAMRDLRRAVGWPNKAPEMKWLEIPTSGGAENPHPVFFPIEMFEKLAESDELFQKTMVGPPGDLEKYWEGLRDTVLYKPFMAKVDPKKTIAAGMHGDGAPTNKIDGIFLFSGRARQQLERQ